HPIIDRTRFTKLAGQWHVDGDELVQTDVGKSYNVLMFGDHQWTAYDFTVDAMRVDREGSFSLLFRSTGRFDELECVVSDDGNRTCFVEDHEQGDTRILGEKRSDIGLEDHKWYTARVHIRGNNVACFLYDNASGRDLRLFDVYDNRHPRGRVGLQTFGAAFRFKNIKTTRPAGGRC